MKHLTLPALLLLLTACAAAPDAAPGADAGQAPSSLGGVTPDAAWLALVDMDGGRHDLASSLAEGREVALVFWQTWCAACIQEAPHVVAAAAERAGRTEFYGVVSGPDRVVDDAQVVELTAELGLTYPQVRDRSADLAERFDVQGTPTIIVIAPSGEITYRGHKLPESWNTH